MTRMATKVMAGGIAKWITEHVNVRRKYKPPEGAGKLRKEHGHE